MSHFYCHTTHLLLLALTNRSSLKAITSSKCPLSEYSQADQRRYLATVISCLSWRSVLDEVLTSSNIWKANDVKTNREVAKVLGPPWRKYCEGQLQNNTKGPQSSSSRQSDPLNFRDSTAATDAHHMLLLVLVHDLLLPGKRLSLASTSTIGKFLSSHKARMSAELVKLQIKKGKRTIDELKEAEPGDGEGEGRWKRGRWIRVNRLNSSMSEVCQWLQEHGFEHLEGDHIPLVKSSQSRSAHQSKKKPALNRAFICPPASSHPPDLLLLPMEATADLVAGELYTQGKIILQDAASCWPAWLLLHPLLSQTSAHITIGTGKKRRRIKQSIHVLDATAAPGNKTSHLSSMLAQLPDASAYESISLTALERDPQRFKTLVSQLRRAGALATNKDSKAGLVTPYKLDFLSLSPEDPQWRPINRMILDPSCSGSGITGRLDWLTKKTGTSSEAIAAGEVEEEASTEAVEEEERLQRLADVQLKMIEHAFQFPNLERLVYSTCSIHHIEDEGVVARALSSRFASSHTSPLGPWKGTHWHWELARREECLPGWNWRGEDHEDISNAAGMMRAYPYANLEDQDTEDSGGLGTHILRTNGFFAACFVRVFHEDGADGEEAEERIVLDSNKRKQSPEDADAGFKYINAAQATMTANAKRNRKKKEAKARQKARVKAEKGDQQ